MKISEMEAGLYCSHCHDETIHVVTYLNEKIRSVECTVCHHKTGVKIDIKKELYKEIYERISTKPQRMTQEYKEDLSKFISTFPIRVLSKPYRLIRYVNETRKVLKKAKID